MEQSSTDIFGAIEPQPGSETKPGSNPGSGSRDSATPNDKKTTKQEEEARRSSSNEASSDLQFILGICIAAIVTLAGLGLGLRFLLARLRREKQGESFKDDEEETAAPEPAPQETGDPALNQ